MKLNVPAAKSKNPIPGNRFQIFLLTVAVVLTGAVFALYIWQTYYFEHNLKASPTGDFEATEISAAFWRGNYLISAIAVVFGFSVFAWLAVVRNLKNSQKNLLRIVGEKRLAETALGEAAQYENLFRHANDAILIFEPETEIILDVNDRACEIYRRRREDFVGRSLKEMSQDISRGTEELEKLLHDGVYDEFESVHLRGDNVPITLLINAAVIEYRGRQAILTINRDITAKKQTEENLRESEQQFRAVTNSARDAIISADARGNVVFWNAEAEKIFGYTEAEIVGKPLQMIMPARHAHAHQSGLERNVATGENRLVGKTVEVPGLRKDGTEFSLELTLGTWESSKGKFFTAVMRDITERKNAEQNLQRNLSILTSTLESTADGILVVGANNEIVVFNEKFAEMWNMTAAELNQLPSASAPQRISEQIRKDGDYHERVNEINLLSGESTFDVLELKDGKIYERYSQPQRLTGEIVGRVFNFRDITERSQAERETSRLAAIVESSGDAIISKNLDGTIVSWNSGAEKLFGYTAREIVGQHISILFPPERLGEEAVIIEKLTNGEIIEQFETTRLRRDGTEIPVSITLSPIRNARGETTGISKIAHDITERKRAEEQLLHDAFHDGLTGLANRALFMNHLQLSIERGKSRRSNFYAVLFLDFDRFKFINDSLGHSEGDNFLKTAAKRLAHATRTGDIVARFGGDEFVVLLSELAMAEDAVAVAERIQEDLKKPFKIGGREIFLSASIGIALSTSGHQKAADMLRDADIAMYRAKSKGRAGHQIFDQAMGEQAARQLSLESEMRQALELGEFELHYQPIIDLATETLTGFESLVRWRHPQRGMISPLEFIAAAEESNFILPLGRWILEESCRRLREWQAQIPAAANLTVSVNLSSKQFAQADLARQIVRALAGSKLDAQFLKLEITESQVMENSEQAIQTMNELRALGIELSLDDFGTGYSSLSYLHRLPAGFLKIDRSFVNRMTESEENAEIVSTIVKLARNLKMRTIAEGIETREQLQRLKRLDCDFGQGYFFSKPMAAADARAFIENAPNFFPPSSHESVINLETNA